MEQPPGFAEPGKEDYVCHLQKALYGLKQARKIWYEHLSRLLFSLGFKQSGLDHGLFIRVKGESIIYLAVHVDDGLMVSNDHSCSSWRKR
jgi:hypothetical protein